jgi:hypothetical protein
VWLELVYHALFWLLIASSAASRRVAQAFDQISFAELSHAYAENLARLFLHEDDLHFKPPWLVLRLFGLRKKQLAEGENILSTAAAEKSARRADVQIQPVG